MKVAKNGALPNWRVSYDRHAKGDSPAAIAMTQTNAKGAARPIQPGTVRGRRSNRVTPDCHFAVQLNHFIPGFLSYLVAVFIK